jgi:hypothetical protein
MPTPALIPAIAAGAEAASNMRTWQNGTDKANVQVARHKTAVAAVETVASVVTTYLEESARVEVTRLQCRRERERFATIDAVNARGHEMRVVVASQLTSEADLLEALRSQEKAEIAAMEALSR